MTATLTPPMPAAPSIPTRTMSIRPNGQRPVTIPPTVVDHESYREWARSDDYPEQLRTHWYDDTLWVETDMEQFYTHTRLKGVFCSVLLPLADAQGAGMYCVEGPMLTLPALAITTLPDGLFVLYASLQSGRVVRVPNARGVGCLEFVGPPEMVLEAVSENSVQKDMVRLADAYQRAGVQEYWRVDVRAGLLFEILRNDGTAWQPCTTPDGWQCSALFGHDFRLRAAPNPLGIMAYYLDLR